MIIETVVPAPEYGQLIIIKNRFVNVYRVRLYDNQRYSCMNTLIRGNILHTSTDQSYDLKYSFYHDVRNCNEVWFNGVRIYSKPWYQRILDKLLMRKLP